MAIKPSYSSSLKLKSLKFNLLCVLILAKVPQIKANNKHILPPANILVLLNIKTIYF